MRTVIVTSCYECPNFTVIKKKKSILDFCKAEERKIKGAELEIPTWCPIPDLDAESIDNS